MTDRFSNLFKGFARASHEGARETFRYYSGAERDAKRLVRASFFMGVTGGLLWYVLILYWNALGFGSKEIGFMGGVGTAAGVATLLVSGYLADKFGRKRLLVLGLVGTAAAFVLFLQEKNILVFTGAYGLSSLSGSLVQPSSAALLASKATPVKMKFLFGVQAFSNQIGLTLATFTGIFAPGFVNELYGAEVLDGYWYTFLVGAACAFAPIGMVMRVSEVPRGGERLLLKLGGRMSRLLLVFSLQNALIGFGAALLIPWFPLVFKEGMGATNTEVALMITLSNVAIAAGWFVVPKFAEFRGSVALVTVCQLASVGFMVAIPFFPNLLVAALLYTARSLLMLVPIPVLNAYLMNIVSEEVRASFFAISTFAWQIAFSAAYVVAGFLWADGYGSVMPFIYCGAFYVTGTLVFFAYFRRIAEPGGGRE